MNPGVAAAGWYADPTGPGHLRWWDGTRWTDHQVPDAAGAAAQPMQQWPSPSRSGGRGPGVAVVIALVAAALAAGLLAGFVVGRATAPDEIRVVQGQIEGVVETLVPGDNFEGFVTDGPVRLGLLLDQDREVTITAASSQLDSLLRLRDSDGAVIGENDDFRECCNSRIDIRLQAGEYVIEASALDQATQGPISVQVR